MKNNRLFVNRLLFCLLIMAPFLCVAQYGYNGWPKQPAIHNAGFTRVLIPAGPLSAAVDSNVGNSITTKLQKYFSGRIAEQAYLHFDKPYYAAGDTIYFKAYLTVGESHEPSSISRVLHVDLINEFDRVYKSILLQVTNGVTWGDFALPDTLSKGTYRVRAYTNWMLNSAADDYFVKAIPIGSIRVSRIPESSAMPLQNAGKPDIQFFPEGGTLVAGIRCKVAFKAIGSDGLGINVKGQVLDSENKQVAIFSSEHLGMGYFNLKSIEGKSYKAKITYPDGSTDFVNLPKVDANGVALTINNDLPVRALVNIVTTQAYYRNNKNKNYTLVIYSGGQASTYNCKLDSQITIFGILKKTLHTGVAAFTLFSPAGEPLSERLIFIQKNDQLKLDLTGDKPIYARREKISLKLKVSNSVLSMSTSHLSVSVINEDKVPVDENRENTILTDLLLTADLKGYVEQPNYYFLNATTETNSDLDLVMLTNGYRRFEWKPVLNNEPQIITHQPEKALEISGVVKLLNGNTPGPLSLSLFSPDGGPMLKQEVGEDGAFRFSNLLFMDSSRFVIKPLDEKLKAKTSITLDKDQPLPVITDTGRFFAQSDVNKLMPAYLDNTKARIDETTKYGSGNHVVLKEVNIKSTYKSSNINGAGYADQVIRRQDFGEVTGSFSDVFYGRLIGVKFVGPQGAKSPYLNITRSLSPISVPMLVVLDGVMLGSDESSTIDAINVSDIETIEVLKSANATAYGVRGAAGVLVITTRHGSDIGDPISKFSAQGLLATSPKGFYKAREFYSPKYDHLENHFSRKDLRTTIYWNPELVTDKNGDASFDYYNADGTGSYRMVVEGIDDKGNIGRTVYRYKVQ